MLSFGSNMSSETLTGRRRVVPRRSLPAVVPGHALSFDMLGLPYAEPAFAVLQRFRRGEETRPQAWWPAVARRERADADAGVALRAPTPPPSPPVAHGVLHLVSREDWRRVLASEGVLDGGDAEEVEDYDDGEDGGGRSSSSSGSNSESFGYRVARVRCLAYSPCARDLQNVPLTGQEDMQESTLSHLPTVEALTLLSAHPQHAAGGRRARPSKRYLSLLQKGAKEHGLSPEYRRWLESLDSYDASASSSSFSSVPAMAARTGLLAAGVAAAAPALPLVALAGAAALGRGGGGAEYANLAQRALWWAHDVALAPVLGDGGASVVGEEGGGGGATRL
jgi:hypothetical protein